LYQEQTGSTCVQLVDRGEVIYRGPYDMLKC
jgi:hypothetical protein